MGFGAWRNAVVCTVALGAVLLLPTSAGALKLGTSNIDYTIGDFGSGCGSESCVWVQKRLPGAQVRAPFSGTIRKWRVASPGVYSFQLVVMRKKRNGAYKNVGQSSPGAAPGAGTYEFPADMPIRKGDFIGIMGETVQGILNPQAQTLTFDPAVGFPDSHKPSFSGDDEYQFNASMRRR